MSPQSDERRETERDTESVFVREKRESFGQQDAMRERPFEDGGRDRSCAVESKPSPEPAAPGRGEAAVFPRASGGGTSLPAPVGELISVVLSCTVCGHVGSAALGN